MEFSELKSLLEKQGDAINAFKADQAARLDEIEKRMNRPAAAGSSDAGKPRMLKAADGREFQLLTKGDRLSSGSESSEFSIGEYVRDCIVGSRKSAMGSGPALVPTSVSDRVIDDVRAVSAIGNSGAPTIMIDGPTVFARINGDPDVIQHVENAEDLATSVVDVGPVTVNPQLLVALVPLSEELVVDSPNLNQVLQTSIAAAFAQKLDELVIAKALADAAIYKTENALGTVRWLNILGHLSAASAVTQRVPDVMLSNIGDAFLRAQYVNTITGELYEQPKILERVREVLTTNIPTGRAIFGGFDRGVMLASRSELRLEVVRWKNATKGQHMLVAHARMDGYIIQPKALSKILPGT